MLDEVTGLRDSRALWKELAQRAAACSTSSPLAVVVLDFDRLADINAHYDRSVGDAVLRRCAKVTGEEAPSARLAFRYREDELVLLVPGDEEDGRELAERVRARIAAQNSTLPAVTVSCGVAVVHGPVEPMVALGKVGPALQAAKRSGGNRVVVATETSRNGHNGHNGNGNGNGGGDETACRAALAMAVASLEARDRATAAHSDDVVTLAESLGKRLGLSDLQLDRLTAAAQLHDVGKLAMPTEILNKPGPLNDPEWEIIREHTVIGERMLRAVPEMGAVANVVRHSHESWDGSGYPDGLAGDEIPLASRIILCADAFHAIRSDRPYRPGRSADDALKEVRACAGQQFDPRVVEALVAIARDVRRANGTGIALPRSRRLAALLAALVVCGGGSAYAASDDVRHVVDEVVKAVAPSTVLHAAEAEAGSPDFALRPIDQVSDIVPVSILTPDLELAPFREPSYHGTPDQAESAIGLPVALIQEPASAESPAEHGTAPAAEDTGPQAGWPPALLVPMPQMGVPVVPAVPLDGAAPTLIPVENIAPEPDAGAPEDKGNPHGDPPAVGNPHGEPPGHSKDDGIPDDIAEAIEEAPPLLDDPPVEEAPPADVVEDIIEESPPLLDEPKEHPEHRHAVEEQPAPLPVIEEEPIPTPDADVVTPTPSIAAPDENIFVPAEEEPAHGPRVSLPEQAAVSAPRAAAGRRSPRFRRRARRRTCRRRSPPRHLLRSSRNT